MKTASIIASLSRNAGGVFESTMQLDKSLAEIPNVRSSVLGLRDEATDLKGDAWPSINVKAFDTWGLPQFGYAPKMNSGLRELDADVLHTQGLWMYPSVVTLNWHRKTKRPYLVSPHGMLDPWALRNSAWKKRVACSLFEGEHLRRAACLRALCQSEAQSIRAFGLRNPIAIIPNGIDLPEGGRHKKEVRTQILNQWPAESGRKILLYLGRIHPKKGLLNLLKAWAELCGAASKDRSSCEWLLAIAGWDQGGHEQELKKFATELGLPWADVREKLPSNSVPASSLLFLGPQFNEAKAACYATCDAFILPSLSEGLPMVVLEAWAYGKPVLMTSECNLSEGFAANAAIRIDPSVQGIAAGLEELFLLPFSELRSRGTNGRNLVTDRFAWPKIAVKMKSVYDWVLGSGTTPECVLKD
jgi:glycosyltransferase involved in cell wall biosynthesis